ncbi:hypothetical protein SUGI_0081860 [Cryptomeria japonica]|uniref:probable 2' cyclic ADP-D-ribose synthase BdTIR n=1 Tax=Cryptomeria japonica TaxID=3369 RepID=UPI002408E073|nr:probable 2' cyclic ADP-D-ribose synthase BdTIR [Cryptomeria japonica]GLJ08132.1 hypothetical protein SUGI_0081860 [Cryptomeria japonica]
MENTQTNAFQTLRTTYDIFINHRGIDSKETVASLVYHNLQNKGYNAFLDKKSVQVGRRIPRSIMEVILSAAVHVAIFSNNYAESAWCLKQLYLMFKSETAIVPVYWGVQPSELRMKDKDTAYARAFQIHKRTRKIRTQKLKKWKKALSKVSRIQAD